MDDNELEQGFRRQVYLYGGLGYARMKNLVLEAFTDGHKGKCSQCQTSYRFVDGHICKQAERSEK